MRPRHFGDTSPARVDGAYHTTARRRFPITRSTIGTGHEAVMKPDAGRGGGFGLSSPWAEREGEHWAYADILVAEDDPRLSTAMAARYQQFRRIRFGAMVADRIGGLLWRKAKGGRTMPIEMRIETKIETKHR